MHKLMMEFPSKVKDVIEQLKSDPRTVSIWFIGSRANGSFRTDSDWDFICFRNTPIEIQDSRSELVDVIQVGNDGKYLLEGQQTDLAGSFANWVWKEIDSNTATYKNRITPDSEKHKAFDISDVKLVTYKAYKIWSIKA